MLYFQSVSAVFGNQILRSASGSVRGAGRRIWNATLHNNNRLKPVIRQECAASETKERKKERWGRRGGRKKHPKTASAEIFFFLPTVGLLNIASSTFPARRRRETIKALLLFPLNRENLHTAALTNATCVNSHACTRTHTRSQTHKQCIAGHMRPGVRWRVPARKPLCVIKHMPQCRRSSQKKKKKQCLPPNSHERRLLWKTRNMCECGVKTCLGWMVV